MLFAMLFVYLRGLMQENCVNGRISGCDEKYVLVTVDTENDCRGCGLKNVCSSKTIEFERSELSGRVEIGQRVELTYEKVLQTSALVYLLPVAFFFAGILFSKYLLHVPNELIQFLAALGFMSLAFLIIRKINNSNNRTQYKISVRPVKQ